jgi:hypothetical protein
MLSSVFRKSKAFARSAKAKLLPVPQKQSFCPAFII